MQSSVKITYIYRYTVSNLKVVTTALFFCFKIVLRSFTMFKYLQILRKFYLNFSFIFLLLLHGMETILPFVRAKTPIKNMKNV